MVVIGDYFTKWVEAVAMPHQEAKTVAEVLVQQFLAKFGAPPVIHMDQGRNFESHQFAEMCKLLGTKKMLPTVYHLQSNGMDERTNLTMGTMIVTAEHLQIWDELLPLLTMAYGATPLKARITSLNRVMLGREFDVIMRTSPEEDSPCMQKCTRI